MSVNIFCKFMKSYNTVHADDFTMKMKYKVPKNQLIFLIFWLETIPMNYRSKIFILSGLYALIALFFVRKLFFGYYYGQEGISLLPINLFELVLFAIAVFVFILILITIAVLVKRNTSPLTFKKRFNFLIPSFMGWIIIFLLLDRDYADLVVPASIIIYGLILLNLNRFVTSRLLYFAFSLILLGIISFFLPASKWMVLTLGFGVFPIIFGLILIKRGKVAVQSPRT